MPWNVLSESMTDGINNDRVELSIVIAVVSDTINQSYDLSILEGCLECLQRQIHPPIFEIIVPYPDQANAFEELKTKFFWVIFLPVNDLQSYPPKGPSREHHDELRARGIAAARGDIITLLEDYGCPDAHWSRNILEAHKQSFAAVGGAIENEIDHVVNWGVYFCDFGKYQNPLRAGETPFASDANTSYKRSALMGVRENWQQSFRETDINETLVSKGEKIALSPYIVIYQHRSDLNITNALKERYVWGRSYAASRIQGSRVEMRVLYAILSPLLPLILLVRMAGNVLEKKRNVGKFIKALPFTTLLVGSWSLGEFSGYIRARS